MPLMNLNIDFDHQAVTRIIEIAAAEEIMPRFGRLASDDINHKKSGDIVTIVDTAMESRLAFELQKIIPSSQIVGEEGVEHAPETLDYLTGNAPVWIIDPLDGTRNFANANPCFAVIVALSIGGKTISGWIHDPVNGETVTARLNMGAWLSDGSKLKQQIRKPDISTMKGSAPPGARKSLEPLGCNIVRYRCVGREYMDLAQGKLDFAIYGGNLKPWDHAAGVLIHRETGGVASLTPDFNDYAPTGMIMNKRLIMAPDHASWDAIKDTVDN